MKKTTIAIIFFFLGLATMAIIAGQRKPEIKTITIYTPQNNLAESTVENDPFLMDGNALAIARVLYGLKHYNLTENAKKAVIEVIMNRTLYKQDVWKECKTISEVCYQSNQWQGKPSMSSKYDREVKNGL